MGYNELYRKNDKGEYEPVNLFFSEYPSEGLWLVRRIRDGNRWTWINSTVEDLPKAMTIASLEPFRDEIIQRWVIKGEEMGEEVTPYDLASILFQVVSEAMSTE